MTRQRMVARGAVLGGGVVLLGVLVYLGTGPTAREPQGVLPHIARDAGLPDGGGPPEGLKDASAGGPASSLLDGAVQLFLPESPIADGVEISPEEMRARHLQQIELIERRIEQIETQLAAQPGSSVLEARLDQLRARRDELRALTEP